VSRLFWNELFIDPRAVPELATCDDARRRVESPALRERVAELERAEFVDYRAQFEIRRPILQALANHAASTPALKERLDRFAADHPNADNYAKFRAACERMGRPWQSWRLGLERELRPGEHFDPAAYSYHLNSQRLAFDQVGSLARRGREGQPALFLDMPLGVRGDGFDVCLKPEIFASHASAGAPPDAFFSSGQVWGFPPLRPEALRRDGYRYLRDSIRHIASQAGMIRIDHVMGMHRLFWVPGGMGAAEGAYVRYPAAEMYAVATLESRRADAAVVGEDLGSVPGYVGPAMRRHNLRRMYAAYFKVHTGDQPSLEEPEPGMFAYINTHDMATFAAFVSGEDIDERRGRGLLTEEAAGHERWERGRALAAMRAQMERDGLLHHGDGDPAALLRALAKWLLRSEAAATVLNLEDLWLEPRPQNVPGTSFERPNWRRRSRLTLDEIKGLLSGLLV
jgi:4-alpha-glucanotransferase